MRLLEWPEPRRRLRRRAGGALGDFHAGGGRDRGAARPQRHGQNHAVARDPALRHSGGTLRLDGRDLVALPAEAIARHGVGYVPAERGIFGSLSVRENSVDVRAADPRGEQHWTLDRVLALFPRLAERLQHGGHNLSGGEQQMLAIGRALMTNPRLLLIDEATEGLAPLVARDIWRTVTAICTGRAPPSSSITSSVAACPLGWLLDDPVRRRDRVRRRARPAARQHRDGAALYRPLNALYCTHEPEAGHGRTREPEHRGQPRGQP